MRPRALLLLALLVLATTPRTASATAEYADRTGQACAVCHRDPEGGGALTRVGESYGAGGHRWPVAAGPTAGGFLASRVARFALGFVHLTTAVVWFGTIFYVHLILRPRYALGGLPPLEVRLAWASMALLAATGVPLTMLRFHGVRPLLETRSGILLLVKIGLFLFLVFSAAVATTVVGPRLRRLRRAWQRNDGREGRPAWVKVGERLYDVSASPRWKDGEHFRRHQAGQDLTGALAGAPHGPETLEPFPVQPAGEAPAQKALVVRAFYVMAYVNLFVALGVLVVIALWRWG
jgi:predicted heme/steroid binding protein